MDLVATTVLQANLQSSIPRRDEMVDINRSKVTDLLRSAGSHVITGYGNLQAYIDTYLEHYLGQSPSMNKEEVLEGLERCQQKPACGFLHEFTRLQGSPNPPPYDYSGPIYPPLECPLQQDNGNCAHSNTLGIMLRAIILTKQESHAHYFLDPFFRLLIQDGIFSLAVQMGDEAYTMEKSGLDQQHKTGLDVMQRVREMIALLSFV